MDYVNLLLDTGKISLINDPVLIKEMENLTKKISAALQSALLIAVKVKLVEPKSLERFAGKSVHVIDKRVLDE